MKTLFRIFVIALIAGAFAACDSNPIEDDDDHEHTLSDIYRLELVMNGQEIVVIEENELTGGDPGRIVVEEGEETPLISLEAFDEDGDEIHLDELDDEYFLEAGIEDETIAEFEQHEEDGRWAFHIHGRAAGATTLELDLMHNPDNPHSDYTTPEIPVEVE